MAVSAPRRRAPHRAGTRSILWATILVVLAAPLARGHEIPADVTVQAFIRPSGDRIVLLVRVPLEAMRDIDFPQQGPYLDIVAAQGVLREAAERWVAGAVRLLEGDVPLAVPQVVAWRVSLPFDRSFTDFDRALASITGPAPSPATAIVPEQALLDVLLETPIRSDRSDFSFASDFARLGLRTTTVLRFVAVGGAERAFQFTGEPGLVRLDPRWHQAVFRFVALGFFHILDGLDHLLFLVCLVLPCRRIRPLLALVTSFTVAHSVTLFASAAGVAPGGLWFPPLIETLIALSIVYMALENIVGARIERRWLIAFGFGLVHGFGFSFALRETLQFAGSHLVTSLLAFNVGVEIGQLFVVALVVMLLNAAFRHLVAERIGTVVLSVIVAHGAWHWMTDRWWAFRQYPLAWPQLDALFAAAVLRWTALLLVLAAAVWLLRTAVFRIDPRAATRDLPAGPGA